MKIKYSNKGKEIIDEKQPEIKKPELKINNEKKEKADK